MTNEEIIKEKIPLGIINVKAVGGGNGKPQYKAEIGAISMCMDAARKDEAIAFAHFIYMANQLEWEFSPNNGWYSRDEKYPKYLTTEQLYQLFKTQTNG